MYEAKKISNNYCFLLDIIATGTLQTVLMLQVKHAESTQDCSPSVRHPCCSTEHDQLSVYSFTFNSSLQFVQTTQSWYVTRRWELRARMITLLAYWK